MSWTCFARVDTVDLPLLKKMKRAGCHQLMYGIENFDPEALRKMKKKIDVSQMKTAISMTRQAGMRCRIALIIGNPGDTKELISENLRQAKKLRP
jgi:anaerobic magnesium-protoporphyrin IX monomethyl ester cyclase